MTRTFHARSAISAGRILLVALMILPRLAGAAISSPINDDFAGRVDLGSGNIHTNGTLLGASQENGERLIIFNLKSVWWVWTATNSGEVTINVDAELEEKDGSFPSLSVEVSVGENVVQLSAIALASGDIRYNGRLAAAATFRAMTGQHYVIALNGGSEVGNYTLDVIQGAPPAVVVDAPRAGAVFKAGDSVPFSAQVLDPDSPVSHITFYTGWDDTFSELGTADEWPFTLNWSNAPPGHYQMVARGWDISGLSTFSLPVTLDVVPRNDAFADRIPLAGSSLNVTGTLANASREVDEPLHAGNDLESIWWSWTAPADGFVTVWSDGWGLGVYTGGELSSLTLVTNGFPNEFGPMAVFAATAGTTYAIAAIGYEEVSLRLRMSRPPVLTIASPAPGATFTLGEAVPISISAFDPEGALISLEIIAGPLQTNITGGAFTTMLSNLPAGGYLLRATATDAEGLSTSSPYRYFYVEPLPVSPPLNDHYTNRFTLTGAPLSVTGTTVNATTELGEGDYHSVWWRWIAPASGPTTVTFAPSSHSAKIYTGDASSALECVGRPSIFFGSGREVFQAQAGVAYQIRVYLHVHLLSPGEVHFQIVQSVPPTITLVSPTNGSHFFSGDIVQLSASAADADGVVSKVEFFSGGLLLGTVTNAPFILPTSFQTDYTTTREVYAVVTDNSGLSSSSGPSSCVIHPPPPANDAFVGRLSLSGSSVSTTGSTERATRETGEPGGGERSVWYSWTAPAGGSFTLTLESWAPTLAIRAFTGVMLSALVPVVESVVETGAGPYRARLALNAIAGITYHIAVVDAGAFTLTIQPGRAPSISITSPANGSTLLHGALTLFEVSVNDPDSGPAKVDFYLNNALIGSVTSPPYSLEFIANGILAYDPGELAEMFFLSAVVTDEQGFATYAAPVSGVIARPPVSAAPNDNFADRILLTGLLARGKLGQEANSSLEPGEPDGLGDDGSGSTWWSWRAPASGEVIVQCERPFAVLTGNVTAVSNLTLVSISQMNDWIHASRFSAMGGTEYQLRVATDYPTYQLQLLLSPAQPAFLSAGGLENGAMRLRFQTVADRDWIFHFSDNLRDWFPFSTNRARLQNFHVLDPGAPSHSRRFYRAVSEP